MKIYLASRYEDRDRMVHWATRLRAMGHTITSRWINGNHEITSDANSDKERQWFAEEDLSDVLESDALIFHSPKVFHRTGRGGRHVELGIAIATGKLIIGIGEPENVFHYLSAVRWVKDLDGLKSLLALWKQVRP